jgi:hypothetical protein
MIDILVEILIDIDRFLLICKLRGATIIAFLFLHVPVVIDMVLRRTYASLDILDGGPPQHTSLFSYPVDQHNSFSVSPTKMPPQTTVLFRTPVACPISRQSSPLGPYQYSLPDRPIFPRSKYSNPNLYRNTLLRRFKRLSGGREFVNRKKISASATDAITKAKTGAGGVLQLPASGSNLCKYAAGVDWEVVDGISSV